MDGAPRADAGLPERLVNNVIVGEQFIFWSHGDFSCPIELGCYPGPTISGFSEAQNRTFTVVDGGVGTRQIAGTEDELFYLYGQDTEHMYLMRLGGAASAALSIPRPRLRGPTVDDEYVYWAEGDLSGFELLIRRATRAGDGLDATTVATSPSELEHLTYSAGYLWWIGIPSSLNRVPVTGGTPERVLEQVTALAATTDGVYVGRWSGTGIDAVIEVGRVDTAGTYEVVASQPTPDTRVFYIVPEGDSLFWSATDGKLYVAPVTGGSVDSIATLSQGYVFAVLPDRYLVDFTRSGFRTIPR